MHTTQCERMVVTRGQRRENSISFSRRYLTNQDTRRTISTVPPLPPTPPTIAARVSTIIMSAVHTLNSTLDDAEVALFFGDSSQMKCSADAVAALKGEGIIIPEDLAEFEDDDIDNVTRNLRKLTTAVNLSAITVKRLKCAAECARYYKSIGRDLSAASMQYNVLNVFWKQWSSLKLQKKDDSTKFPKMDRNTTMLKWTELAANALGSRIGTRNAPLSYVIRPSETVPDPPPALENGKPWSIEHGSIRMEMEARLSFDDPVFDDDSAALFDLLCEALHGTQYAATLISFKRKRDGRGAWIALLRQYAGKDRWEAELKKEHEVLTTHTWKGNNNITLAKHTEKHRSSFINMTTCAIHIEFQLPNERTRVKYLTDSIKCPDAGIHARLANISADDTPTGMRGNFELAVQHLLPADPVKQKTNTSRGSGASVSVVEIKAGKGHTGVDLRWHPPKEFKSLSPEQKDELMNWRETAEGKAASDAEKAAKFGNKFNKSKGNKRKFEGKKGNSNSNKKGNAAYKKMVASVVAEAVEAHATKAAETAQIGALATNLTTFLNVQTPAAPAAAAAAAAVSVAPDHQQIVARLQKMIGSNAAK
jgi:hypothetical protein